jgi:hypothetical protein
MQLTSLQTLNPRCNATSVATAFNTLTYVKESRRGNLYLQNPLVQSKSNLMNQVQSMI